MKRISAKNSLAFLCILAGIVYLLILIPAIIRGIEGGVVALIISTVMKRAIEIKEEQDLTI
ncbi:hypothetical protein [Proteiniphilum sp.]|uniref:hypothetical protein n=1 Tax=Proteiniphilum sp. TaxID=1926877 RepID=UPI003328CE53